MREPLTEHLAERRRRYLAPVLAAGPIPRLERHVRLAPVPASARGPWPPPVGAAFGQPQPPDLVSATRTSGAVGAIVYKTTAVPQGVQMVGITIQTDLACSVGLFEDGILTQTAVLAPNGGAVLRMVVAVPTFEMRLTALPGLPATTIIKPWFRVVS